MADAQTNKFKPRVLWTVAALLLILVFFGVRRMTREKLPLRVAAATRQDLVRTVSTNGKVEPQVNFEAHAPLPGVVKHLYVHSGEKVHKGQLLLSLGDADAAAKAASALAALRGAQASDQATQQGGTQEEQLALSAELSKAKLDRDQAQHDVDALTKLQSQGAASASEVAAAQQRLALANASLQSVEQRKTSRYGKDDLAHAQATLAEAQAGYSAASQVVAQSNVRAPFDGTVYSLPVSQTEYVHEGQELLQMADLRRIQVRAYFDEPEIGGLKLGYPVTIVWDALQGRTWHGHIVRVPSTIITYGTRNVGEVLVTVDDSDGALLPNTNVTVTVTEQHLDNVLTVPREALHSESGKNFVFKFQKGALRRTPVKVGAINLTEVQITSGLAVGDLVALSTTNGELLVEGVPARVVR
ncbi:MAG: efflux RND transporter periplasmic adaptor subunit [Acidobacteriaceae bacterium]